MWEIMIGNWIVAMANLSYDIVGHRDATDGGEFILGYDLGGNFDQLFTRIW